MIHVGVRNERMRDAQEFARGQRRHVAEVEQQCPAAETEIDEQRRIRKGIVDEPRLHEPSHVVPLLVRSAQTCRRVRHRASQRPWGGELSTRYLMVEQTPKMPPRRRGGTLSTSAARQVPSGRRSPALASSMIRLAICTLVDSRMPPPQSVMFTEPTTWMQRLPSGQHCGARNA